MKQLNMHNNDHDNDEIIKGKQARMIKHSKNKQKIIKKNGN